MNNSEWLQNRIGEAIRQKLIQQDQLCLAIKGFQSFEATPTELHKLVTLGWAGLLVVMENECYPPQSEDWKRWLDVDWDDNPFNVALQNIGDPNLRGSTKLLQGVSDQAERQSALAKFLSYVGGYSLDVIKVFALWSQRSAVEKMQKQYVSSKMTCDYGLEILRITIQAIDLLGEKAVDDLAESIASITERQGLFLVAPTSLRSNA